jgi:hypothetical protein
MQGPAIERPAGKLRDEARGMPRDDAAGEPGNLTAGVRMRAGRATKKVAPFQATKKLNSARRLLAQCRFRLSPSHASIIPLSRLK